MSTQNDRRGNGNGDRAKQASVVDDTATTASPGNADLFGADQSDTEAVDTTEAPETQGAVPAGVATDRVSDEPDVIDAPPVADEAPDDDQSADDTDDSTVDDDAEYAEDVDEADTATEDAEDHNCTEDFKPAPAEAGEFQIRVGEIGDWEYHFRRFSPLKGAHSSALALSASDPTTLRPIKILEVDGRYVVVDGRFLLQAIREAHPGDPEVMIRVVFFPGTEKEAVEAMCNEGFGREPATKMEMAHGLLALQRSGRKSQTALADQYAALTKDKVSQMLIAARLQDAYPVLFELILEPHRLPISWGVSLNKVVKALPRPEFVDLLARAKKLVAEGERCTPDEFYDLVGLQDPAPRPAKSPAKAPTAAEAAVAEAIFGEDDKPVGAATPLVDGGEQFFLPPTDAIERMTASEREAAANAFIARIIRYFGLEKPG